MGSIVPSGRYFPDSDADDARHNAYQRQKQRRAAIVRQPNTANTAAIASALKANYPTMTPGVIAALALKGIGPDDPIAQQLAKPAGQAQKKKKSKPWWKRAPGNVVDKVSDVGRATGGLLGEDVRNVGKGAARGLEIGLKAPLEAGQGLFRNTADVASSGAKSVGAAASPMNSTLQPKNLSRLPAAPEGEFQDPIEQTTLGVVVDKWSKGEEVKTGSGFFVDLKSEVAEEQARRAREAFEIDGKAGTPGRLLATSVFEPGTRGYNMVSGITDAAIAIYADPSNKALGAVSKARQARKVFNPAVTGLVKGRRTTVLPKVADQYLASTDGRKVVSWLAETDDTARIWKTLGRKVDVKTSTELADARTEDEVLEILRREINSGTIHEKPHLSTPLTRFKPVGGYGIEVKRKAENVRLLQSMPFGGFNLNNLDDAVDEMDRALKNAKFAPAEVDEWINKLARSKNIQDMDRVIKESMAEQATRLLKVTDGHNARKLTQMFKDYDENLRAYFVDEHGDNVPVLGAVINGQEKALPRPHLFVEMINDYLPGLNAREIRRSTSVLGRAMNHGALDFPVAALDFAMQEVWKPMTLLRGAWTIRVVGEEQVRMGFSGLDSMLSHPLRAIAWAAGDETKIGKAVSKVGIKAGRGEVDVRGVKFADESAARLGADEFSRALSRRGASPWKDRVAAKGFARYRRTDEKFGQAWTEELRQLQSDPVARRVAGGWRGDHVPGGLTGNHVEDAKRWFWDGPGSKFRKEMADGTGHRELLTRDASDAYIESVHRRIKIKTGENSELSDLIATGKLNGEELDDRKLAKRLQQLADDQNNTFVPEVVKGQLVIGGPSGNKVSEGLDKAVDFMFYNLMSRPTNYLSRSPAFRQFYWDHAEALMPRLQQSAQETLIANARLAKLEPSVIKRMERVAKSSTVGEVQLDELDLIAKGHGLEKTKKLLYDLSDRSQFFDVTRNIFPFGEAWKEILGTWAKIGTENPRVVRRLQQGVQAGRGAGFFTKDPQSGEEVFVYPGSEFLTKKVAGVPFPLEGRVAGLNLFSTTPYVPGVGPAVQWSVGKIIPNKPEWDFVREMLLPFGEPGANTGGELLDFKSHLPAWFRKFLTANADPDSDRQFASTVAEVQNYLVSTGEFNLRTDAAQERTEKEAIKRARLLYVIRGVVQAGAPTAPSPREMGMDKSGRLITAYAFTDEYRKMLEKSPETATVDFLEKFGENALLYMQPKSSGGFQPLDKLHEWVREHPKEVRRYPDIYGYFAPGGGEFSFSEYDRQLATGERKPLKPRERMQLANARVAGAAYKTVRDAVGPRPTEEQRRMIKEYQNALIEEYPGYQPALKNFGQTEQRIIDLRKALKEPKLKNTEVGTALSKYFEVRDAISEADPGFARTKRSKGYRAALRQYGDALAEENPRFRPVWDDVLERELADDAVEEAA